MRRSIESFGAAFVVAALAAVVGASGCSSKPYCLNCGNGAKDLGVADVGVDAGAVDLSNLGQDTGLITTDGGGTLCTLSPAQLAVDPNNCGFCGNVCDFTGKHQLGACVIGDGGTPGCAPSACEPGWVNLTGNPADGCNYQCIPADGGVDVCNGVDDDCDGKIDNNFTATYGPNGTPRYDSDANNCGGCGFACELPGANNVCVLNAAIDKGQCQVASCINSVAQGTYRHNPTDGDINVTGCEYHCPSAAASPGPDCNSNGACTFPGETCNGVDDDCNFVVDDNPTDPSLGGACGTACPGGNVNKCVGACKAGTTICKSGVLLCNGSTGPSPEKCDGVDNDCDGKIDDPFTATYKVNGTPNYDLDPNNCGSCAGTCALSHAINGCHGNGGTALGNCYVVSCNAGFNYATHTDTAGQPGSCNVNAPGSENSPPGNNGAGVGCYYACPIPKGQSSAPPSTPEVCDGYDNDCNGCTDDALSAPSNFCSKQGACAGSGPGQSPATLYCNGASGWQCDYYTTLVAKGAPVDLSAANRTGTLQPAESECDGLDNNCNGACDENFPSVAVVSASCSNRGRVAKSCSTGQGVCVANGSFACSADTKSQVCSDVSAVPPVPLPANGNIALAKDELCDGKDNNCNGKIDESTNDAATGTKGWHDPTVQVAVPADPSYQGLGAHTIFMYTQEATRPDATAGSPGSLTTRACSNGNEIPWDNVTYAQAQAACAAAAPTGRLCTTTEWQTACEGPVPPAAGVSAWSLSMAPTQYPNPAAIPPGGVCNDANQAATHQIWATGSAGRVATEACYTDWGAGGHLHDLSGNLAEWTQTPTYTYKLSGVCSIVYNSVGHMRLNASSPAFALTAANIGDLISLSGSATPSHNGIFQITGVPAAGSVDVANAAVLASFTTQKNISWEGLVASTYYGVRGGSYTSPQGGTTCEFNFDIAQPTFANNDLGFRCCFTTQP